MKQKLWIILIFFAIALLSYIFWPNFKKLQDLQLKNRELEEKIHKIEEKNVHLRKKIDSLRNDPVYLEKIAREELSMSESDEIIYKFE